MSFIRVIVQSAGIWWILLGIPALGAIASAMPSQHPLVILAAFVWVVGVVPACVLSASSGRDLGAGFRTAWRAGRTWFAIVGAIGLAGIVLSLIIH